MIIDASVYAGHWPFRTLEDNTVQAICDNAEKNDITHIIISSLNSVFYRDTFEGNRELMEEIKACKTSVKILPLAVVNPMYPGWEKYARRAIAEEGFCGFEIFPLYHNYSFGPVQKGYFGTFPAADVFNLAKELDVPVRINMSFENFRQRHWNDIPDDPKGDDIYASISKCPGVKLIINSSAPYAMGEKMQEYIKNNDNILFDITRLDGFVAGTANATINYMSTDHLCFGSMSPFQYAETNLFKMKYVKQFKDKGIEADNIRKIFPQI